jgi:predicted nuclease of predicted toxin-antitoxin system
LSNSRPQHRLLADECVYQATVEFLRGLSYDVVTVQELGLEGAKDVTIIQQAVALERALLTWDMDFSSILLYPPAQYLGIVVLKMTPQTTHAVHSVLSQALSDAKDLRHALLVVAKNKYRLRR